MRIAAISDVHGNLGALSAVLAGIRRRGCGVAVNPGSILSGPLQPAETAGLLMTLDRPHDVASGDPRARHAMAEESGTTWRAQPIAVDRDRAVDYDRAVDRDREAAAVLASRRGRPDRAYALRTGRVPPKKEH